jgi:hypothetical protein
MSGSTSKSPVRNLVDAHPAMQLPRKRRQSSKVCPPTSRSNRVTAPDIVYLHADDAYRRSERLHDCGEAGQWR